LVNITAGDKKSSGRKKKSTKKSPEEIARIQAQIGTKFAFNLDLLFSKASKLSDVRNNSIEPCEKCGKNVYLAERVEISKLTKKKIYHKTCFRFAAFNNN
jgi:hypothetical protein